VAQASFPSPPTFADRGPEQLPAILCNAHREQTEAAAIAAGVVHTAGRPARLRLSELADLCWRPAEECRTKSGCASDAGAAPGWSLTWLTDIRTSDKRYLAGLARRQLPGKPLDCRPRSAPRGIRVGFTKIKAGFCGIG
jgi:hypothetical protein